MDHRSVAQCLGWVRGVARAYARDAFDEDDLTQDSFVAVLRSLDRGSRPRHLRAFVVVVARRTCIEHLRARYRAAQRRIDLASHDRAARQPSALDALLTKEAAEIANSAVGRLPPRYRDALRLSALEGLDVSEVAARLGAKPATVRTWLFRARRLLRRGPGMGSRPPGG